MKSQGCVLFVARALKKREANCLIGHKADGNRKYASRQAALVGVVSGQAITALYQSICGGTVLC